MEKEIKKELMAKEFKYIINVLCLVSRTTLFR